MKNLFLAVIATGLIFATSCKKEEPIENPNVNAVQNHFNLKAAEGRHFYDNGEDDYGCETPAQACSATDVQVKAEHKEPIDNVFNTIDTGDQEAIINAFTNNYDILIVYLPKYLVEGVITKKYQVKARGKNLAGKGRYMLFYQNEERIFVMPFVYNG